MGTINAATEGYPDEIVVRTLCRASGISISRFYNCRGKSNLDKRLSAYNEAARYYPWLIVRDLDFDARCAAELINKLIPNRSPHLRFRIAVREIEAWLLADAERFAKFLGISKNLIPKIPDELDNPKQDVINLVRRSRSRALKEDMLPRADSGSYEGPAYASRIAEFTEYSWRPKIAAKTSDSLRRCLVSLESWAKELKCGT
jgi:hypothetical protein